MSGNSDRLAGKELCETVGCIILLICSDKWFKKVTQDVAADKF